MVYNLRLMKDFDSHDDIPATYLRSQDDAKFQPIKTWFDVGIFPFDDRATTNEYLIDSTPCYTLFEKGASKAMLNEKFYFEHPILHQYPKYPMNGQPIQAARDQPMTVENEEESLDYF